MFRPIMQSLRGTNLEVFKFGVYVMFPIGWMYYFGTNLENRFSVPDFWPSSDHSHKIPVEREEIKDELDRLRKKQERQNEIRRRLEEARTGVRNGVVAGHDGEGETVTASS